MSSAACAERCLLKFANDEGIAFNFNILLCCFRCFCSWYGQCGLVIRSCSLANEAGISDFKRRRARALSGCCKRGAARRGAAAPFAPCSAFFICLDLAVAVRVLVEWRPCLIYVLQFK